MLPGWEGPKGTILPNVCFPRIQVNIVRWGEDNFTRTILDNCVKVCVPVAVSFCAPQYCKISFSPVVKFSALFLQKISFRLLGSTCFNWLLQYICSCPYPEIFLNFMKVWMAGLRSQQLPNTSSPPKCKYGESLNKSSTSLHTSSTNL